MVDKSLVYILGGGISAKDMVQNIQQLRQQGYVLGLNRAVIHVECDGVFALDRQFEANSPDIWLKYKEKDEAHTCYTNRRDKTPQKGVVNWTRIDNHDQTLEDYGHRLETIEADMGRADRHITESQATEISQAIRAIALVLSKASGQNEYGRCWGEFYRKFGVSKYRHLPTAKFDEAIRFLDEWHQSLVGDSPF